MVGNPPFLNQLGRATVRPPAQARQLRSRLGEPVAPYADAAALFLAEAVTWLAPGGRLALIVPESLLAARDAGPARAAARAGASLVGFWWPGTQVFDAAVDVCAPVLARGAPPGPVRALVRARLRAGGRARRPRRQPIRRARGAACSTGPARRRHASWPGWIAPSGWARWPEATAGFRDQFYGLAPHVREHATPGPTPSPDGGRGW